MKWFMHWHFWAYCVTLTYHLHRRRSLAMEKGNVVMFTCFYPLSANSLRITLETQWDILFCSFLVCFPLKLNGIFNFLCQVIFQHYIFNGNNPTGPNFISWPKCAEKKSCLSPVMSLGYKGRNEWCLKSPVIPRLFEWMKFWAKT